MSISDLRTLFDRETFRREMAETSLRNLSKKRKTLQKELREYQTALTIVQRIATMTQQELEYRVSQLASLVMGAIFDDPYRVDVQFVVRRGRTEADIYFERDGKKIPPMMCTGGGAVDVASFSLQLTEWSLSNPKMRNTFIMDEPFKNINDLSRTLHKRTASAVKEVCDKLGIQIIMVSLIPEMDEYRDEGETKKIADKVFQFSIKDGVTRVKVINKE